MKVLFSIFFITLLFIEESGKFMYLSVRNQLYERAATGVLEKMPLSELEAISYTDKKNDIQWGGSEKCFLLNDELFDVVKTKSISGKLYFFCIKEMNELEILEKLVQNTSVMDNKDTGVLVPVFQCEYFLKQTGGNQLVTVRKDLFYPWLYEGTLKPVHDVMLPPPRPDC